jgi:cytoskeletal protein RodZ
MKCPYCGYENPDGVHFCSGCGKKLDGLQAEQQDSRAGSGCGGQENRQEYGYGSRYEEEDDYERRRRQRRDERSRERQRREERKIMLIGIILACVVVVAGIGAYFGVTRFMGGSEESTAELPAGGQDGQGGTAGTPSPSAEPTSTPAPTVTATPTPTATSTPTPTPTPTEEPLTVSLTEGIPTDLSAYDRAEVSQAAASSTVTQEGYDNSVYMALDGDPVTSWQEGVDGDGIGEVLQIGLEREYEIKYMTFRLGNWRDAQRYSMNNRPKTMTVWLDDLSFQVTFPDGQTEQCLEFSSPCPASEIYIRIDSVYQGTEWDDTCISEIGIYGK